MLPFRPLVLLAIPALLGAALGISRPESFGFPARFSAAPPLALDSTLKSSYRWRNVGPDRGGRSIAASGVKGRPKEAYFGAVGGGLWKTIDGGTTWGPSRMGRSGALPSARSR